MIATPWADAVFVPSPSSRVHRAALRAVLDEIASRCVVGVNALTLTTAVSRYSRQPPGMGRFGPWSAHHGWTMRRSRCSRRCVCGGRGLSRRTPDSRGGYTARFQASFRLKTRANHHDRPGPAAPRSVHREVARKPSRSDEGSRIEGVSVMASEQRAAPNQGLSQSSSLCRREAEHSLQTVPRGSRGSSRHGGAKTRHAPPPIPVLARAAVRFQGGSAGTTSTRCECDVCMAEPASAPMLRGLFSRHGERPPSPGGRSRSRPRLGLPVAR